MKWRSFSGMRLINAARSWRLRRAYTSGFHTSKMSSNFLYFRLFVSSIFAYNIPPNGLRTLETINSSQHRVRRSAKIREGTFSVKLSERTKRNEEIQRKNWKEDTETRESSGDSEEEERNQEKRDLNRDCPRKLQSCRTIRMKNTTLHSSIFFFSTRNTKKE